MTDPDGLPEWTGDQRIDDAVALLADLAGRPTSGHVEIFEQVHRALQAALADLDGG